MIFYKQDGKITNSPALKKTFDELPDGKYSLEVKIINRRSLNQNDYFHSIMLEYILAGLRDAGFTEVKTKDDAKTVVKSLFLSSERTIGEVTIKSIKKTSALSKAEFSEFIDNIMIWSSDYLGINIPEAESQSKINM